MKTVFVILLIALLGPAEGFIPDSLAWFGEGFLTSSFKDVTTHEDMTKIAHLEVAAEVLRDNPNPSDRLESSRRLSALSDFDEEDLITAYYGHNYRDKINDFENAVEDIQNGNSNTDYPRSGEKHLAAAHFDSEQFESGQDRLIKLRQSVVSSIQAGDYNAARRDSGRMFHTLQDFYSHTNWIENGNRAPNPVLGQPDQEISNIAGPKQQTCTDIDCVKKTYRFIWYYYECKDNIVKSLIQNGILTSGYTAGGHDSDGNVIQKPSGKCTHGDFHFRLIDNAFARNGINKDGPYRLISPHHYLHDEAIAVAKQATIDMLRNLRRDVNNDQQFGEYLGVFQSQAAVENTAPIGSQAYLRGKIRNILLQQHMGRINGKKNRYSREGRYISTINLGWVILCAMLIKATDSELICFNGMGHYYIDSI
jgi:hypothetical protein